MEAWDDNELGLLARRIKARRRHLTIEAAIALTLINGVMAIIPDIEFRQ